jgi:hypothetical protein
MFRLDLLCFSRAITGLSLFTRCRGETSYVHPQLFFARRQQKPPTSGTRQNGSRVARCCSPLLVRSEQEPCSLYLKVLWRITTSLPLGVLQRRQDMRSGGLRAPHVAQSHPRMHYGGMRSRAGWVPNKSLMHTNSHSTATTELSF